MSTPKSTLITTLPFPARVRAPPDACLSRPSSARIAPFAVVAFGPAGAVVARLADGTTMMVDALKAELGIEEKELATALTAIMESLFGEDDSDLTVKQKANKCAEECGLALRAK